MESRKSSSVTDGDYAESSSIDILIEKKRKLENQIKDLKNTLQQFKELNVTVNKSSTENIISDIPDIGSEVTQVDIQFELYKYAGLYCMKSSKDQKVFGFNSSAKEQCENEFAVQFIKQKGNVKTGKWVMPMSVDMEQLLSEVQLTNVRDVLHFIRNCKQHIDCHESRLQQFEKLKSFADNLKNCNLQTNLGYTFITLELLRVYDKINGSYFNVSIYLWYNSKGARPATIKFETLPEDIMFNKATENKLKKSVKVFRFNDLKTAFDKIFDINNVEFTWERTEKGDDIMEINESSSLLEDEILTYKRISRKRKTKTGLKKKLKKHRNKKKKVDSSSNGSNEQGAIVKEINKPTNSKVALKVTSNIVKSTLKYQSTLDQYINKPHLTSKRKNDSKSTENKYNMKPVQVVLQKLNEKYTSTPIKSNPKSKTPFKVLPSIDISKINVDNS